MAGTVQAAVMYGVDGSVAKCDLSKGTGCSLPNMSGAFVLSCSVKDDGKTKEGYKGVTGIA